MVKLIQVSQPFLRFNKDKLSIQQLQKDKQKYKHTNRHRFKHTSIQRNKHNSIQRNKHSNKQRNKHTNRLTYK